MAEKLSSGIKLVLIANIINLFFSLITNFALPKYLSVESYAAIKTFMLYVSFAGILHLGYEDGMYLKYGGREKGALNILDLDINASTLRVFQGITAVLMLLVGWLLQDEIVLAFAAVLLPYNMMMYFKQLYQAIGEFSLYGRIMNTTTILLFAVNMLLLFVLKAQSYSWYLLSNVLVYLIVWIALELRIRKSLKVKLHFVRFSLKEFKENIYSGFLLMLGNFSSVILTSMDRWFVKFLLNTLAFAEYSFAVSIENFVNVAVTPITITLYNFFCQVTDIKKIKEIRNSVLLFATVVVTCAFPTKWFLQVWLTEYINSLDVIFMLFCSQIYFIVIKGIYVNLYKAQKKQKPYFIKLAIVIIAGFFFNILFFLINHEKEAFSLGTLLSSILWFCLCQLDFNEIWFRPKEYLYLILETVLFLGCGRFLSALYGGLAYVCGTFLFALLLMREDVERICIIIRKLF